jgi:Tol biopolymer transport system component
MKPAKWIAVWASAVVGLMVTVVSQSAAAPPDAYKVEETRLGPMPDPKLSPVFSNDGRHVAYILQTGEKRGVVFDGQASAEYDQVAVTFSPDGKRLAYVVSKGQKQLVVVDGKESPEYDNVRYLNFSPDSQRLAYAAKTGQQWFAVVDGAAGPGYNEIFIKARSGGIKPGVGTPCFSPDSKHVVYIAWTNGGQIMVVDGQAGPTFVTYYSVVFSPDGQRMAYLAENTVPNGSGHVVTVDGAPAVTYVDAYLDNLVFSPDSNRVAYQGELSGDRRFTVVDGKQGPTYDSVTHFRFSPDGKRYAYEAVDGSKKLVVVDGQAGDKYDRITDFAFSPDGRHLVYAAQTIFTTSNVVLAPSTGTWVDVGTNQVKWVAVLDGKIGAGYDGIGSFPANAGGPIFSPDGKHMAYCAEQGEKELVVLDDKPGANFDQINDPPIFSLDSRHLAYLAKRGKTWLAVVDSQPGAEYDAVGYQSLVFSPDGNHVAYIANKGAKSLVVLDGQVGAEYDAIAEGPPVFSPDSKHLAYAARTGKTWQVVMDGQAGAAYNVIERDKITKRSPVFNADGVLEFLATRDSSLYRVQYTPAQ